MARLRDRARLLKRHFFPHRWSHPDNFILVNGIPPSEANLERIRDLAGRMLQYAYELVHHVTLLLDGLPPGSTDGRPNLYAMPNPTKTKDMQSREADSFAGAARALRIAALMLLGLGGRLRGLPGKPLTPRYPRRPGLVGGLHGWRRALLDKVAARKHLVVGAGEREDIRWRTVVLLFDMAESSRGSGG